MSSPFSTVIANLVMEYIEQKTLASTHVKPLFWKRYVDVRSSGSKNEVEIILNHLNSIEPSIQFTVEREKKKILPFLDSIVKQTDHGKCCIPRKPTHTEKYVSFDSHHPICHKKSVPIVLCFRSEEK